MVALKVSQARARHLLSVLEEKLGGKLQDEPRSVLSQLLFNIIARNFTRSGAQKALERLQEQFVDWNEVRVSSVSEIMHCLEDVGAPNAELKAKNLKKILIDIYNDYNQISLEFLREYTEGKAKKVLEGIRGGTKRVVEGVLLFSLDHAVVPQYSPLLRVCRRVGIIDQNADGDKLKDVLSKVVPRKSLELFSRLVILHGEQTCGLPKPQCRRCPLNDGWCEEPARLAAMPKQARQPVTEPDLEEQLGRGSEGRKQPKGNLPKKRGRQAVALHGGTQTGPQSTKGTTPATRTKPASRKGKTAATAPTKPAGKAVTKKKPAKSATAASKPKEKAKPTKSKPAAKTKPKASRTAPAKTKPTKKKKTAATKPTAKKTKKTVKRAATKPAAKKKAAPKTKAKKVAKKKPAAKSSTRTAAKKAKPAASKKKAVTKKKATTTKAKKKATATKTKKKVAPKKPARKAAKPVAKKKAAPKSKAKKTARKRR